MGIKTGKEDFHTSTGCAIDHLPSAHPAVFCPRDQETWAADSGAVTKALEIATNLKVTFPPGRPAPGMRKKTAKRYGILSAQCLLAEDRPAIDIAAGRIAGGEPRQILFPGTAGVPPEGIVPDYRIRNLGELQTIWKTAIQ